MADFVESDELIKISGKVNQSNIYNGFKDRNITTKPVASVWFIHFYTYFIILSDSRKFTISPYHLGMDNHNFNNNKKKKKQKKNKRKTTRGTSSHLIPIRTGVFFCVNASS